MDLDVIAQRLRKHYIAFLKPNRILLTGHSHQAWPDVAQMGLMESFEVAARHVDEKHAATEEKKEILRSYLRGFYNDPRGLYAFDQNAQILLLRWLSAIDFKAGDCILCSDQEFHSAARILKGHQHRGVKIIRIPSYPANDFLPQAERAIENESVRAIIVSHVFFESGLIMSELPELAHLSRSRNIPMMVDVYHGTNVVPLALHGLDMEHVYLVGGGYKYLQWGEGCCFLRYPADSRMEPLASGWFADMDMLRLSARDAWQSPLRFPDSSRFNGSTFEAASYFRAARVCRLFESEGLHPPELRKIYRGRVQELIEKFTALNLDPRVIKLAHPEGAEARGGFLTLGSPYAAHIQKSLRDKNIWTDSRGQYLRLGPAPYTLSSEIATTLEALKEIARALA